MTFSGFNKNLQIETGLDSTKEIEGDIEDSRFFESDFGEGKAFPGGPSYFFSGKQAPCYV